MIMASQAEVNAQIVLGKITAAAKHLAGLHEISGSGLHARVQGEAIALHTFQLEADPVVLGAALRLKNYRLAF